MTQIWPSRPDGLPTSFPYARIASIYGRPYELVLWYAGVLDDPRFALRNVPHQFRNELKSIRWPDEPWATATMAAWQTERNRRRDENANRS